MSIPALKIVNGPSPTRLGGSEASLSGLASATSAFSQAVDLMPHNPLDLHQFLTFRSAISKQAARRSKWSLGKLYNRMAGEDPDYVSLSGVHLRQTLTACKLATPDFIVADGEYKLRLDYVIRALAGLKAEISKNP